MAEEKGSKQSDIKRIIDQAKKAAFDLPPVKVIAEHKVVEGETLSHLALKYYGKATRDHWMVIYEYNKGVIGDNPGMIKIGTLLKIPELPANLKK